MRPFAAAVHNRLLAPLQAWATSGRVGEAPAVLFYFSGHGSRALAANKPSGFDETLVPHDSRTDGIYDIKDWELGAWLAALTQYSDNVTVILDCCHSGSGTRSNTKLVTDVRGCPEDLRPQPDAGGVIGSLVGAAPVMRGALDLSQHREHLNYVLIAACRNDEKAHEQLLGSEARRQGLLTYWLLDTLRQTSPHQPLTYRDLYNQVRHRVSSSQRNQTPQCEGDRDRLFLGDVRRVQGRRLTVRRIQDGLVWVNSGQAQGLNSGTILHLYPPGISSESDPQQPPLAVLEVEQVAATESGCRLIDGMPLDAVPPGALALVHRYGQASRRTKVALDLAEGWFLNAVRERLLRDDIFSQIELALPSERAALRLTLVGETLQLQRGDGQQLYQSYNLRKLNPMRRPFHPNDLEPVVQDLRHLLNQAHVRDLASDSRSPIATAVTVTVERLLSTAPLQTAPLPSVANQPILLPAGEPFVLTITNHHEQPLYFTVLELGYKGDVTRLYPQITGEHVAVAHERSLSLGADPAKPFVMRLPAGVQSVEETIKVIATLQEASFDHLLQGELSPPPPTGPVMRSGTTRHLRPMEEQARQSGSAPPADQWGVVEVRVKIVNSIGSG
ncbi:MAG: caspase family protein [Caldilineaceae bacterium]